MKELSRRIVILSVVLCVLQAAILVGAAANITVSTHVTVVTGTDGIPSPTGSGGTGGSSGGGGGGGSGDSSGGSQTSSPADVADGEAEVDDGASIRETGNSDASSPATLLKNTDLREGNLTCLVCGGEAVVGNVLKITGVFLNPGPTDTNATLVGNVFRNGAFIGVIDGDMRAVEGGAEENLSMNLTLREPGNYLVRAHVVYGGKMTGVSEMSFVATDGGRVPFLFPFVGAALLITVYAAVRWQRRNS